MPKREFTVEEATRIGQAIGIDWKTSKFPVEQFRMGLAVELEHGTADLQRTSRTTISSSRARSHTRTSTRSRTTTHASERWSARPRGVSFKDRSLAAAGRTRPS